MSQSSTLDRKDKVKHYIRIKIHNNIALRFWCKIGVKYFICVRLMSYDHINITITIYALRFWCKTDVKCLICVRLMSYNHIEP